MIWPPLPFALLKYSLSPTGEEPAMASTAACLQDALTLPVDNVRERLPLRTGLNWPAA